MRRALLIVGKAPLAGRAKTRLAPPLTFDEAAWLYRGFLLDTVAMSLDLGWERVCVVHPRGSAAGLHALLPGGVALMEQPEAGLQDALTCAFARHLAAGFQRVVLVGSDTPTLAPGLIEQACRALDDHDLTIGPSADGGYYLIGMRQPQPAVFEAIDWSTSRVYAQTLARTCRLGLRVHRLDEWFDVDEPADLERLRRDLRDAPKDLAPRTRAALDSLAGPATPG